MRRNKAVAMLVIYRLAGAELDQLELFHRKRTRTFRIVATVPYLIFKLYFHYSLFSFLASLVYGIPFSIYVPIYLSIQLLPLYRSCGSPLYISL